MKIDTGITEMCIGAIIEPTDIETLPKGIQDCYNGLCKYTKAKTIDEITLKWEHIYDEEDDVFQLFVAVKNEADDIVNVSFYENEDFVLTELEKTAVKNSLIQLMAKNYMGEGVTKCV